MAEFFAIIGGIAACINVATFAMDTGRRARELAKNMKKAGGEVEMLARELHEYGKILRLFGDTMDTVPDDVRLDAKVLDSELNKTYEVISRLEAFISDLGSLVVPVKHNFVQIRWNPRLRWALRRKKVEVLKWFLLSSKCNISILLSVARIEILLAILRGSRTIYRSTGDDDYDQRVDATAMLYVIRICGSTTR